jgi:myosin heavy subunit
MSESRKWFVKAQGNQLDVPVSCKLQPSDNIDLTKPGEDRWIYTVIQSVDPSTNPTSMTAKWLTLVVASALTALQAELEQVKEEAQKDYEDLRKFQAKYIQADQQLTAANAELEQAINQRNEFSAQLMAAKSEIAKANETIEFLRAECNDFDDEVVTVKAERDRLREVLKNYSCPYCLDTQKEMAYPRCLEYQACKALKGEG